MPGRLRIGPTTELPITGEDDLFYALAHPVHAEAEDDALIKPIPMVFRRDDRMIPSCRVFRRYCGKLKFPDSIDRLWRAGPW